jgi:hypothetical protein
MSDVDSTPRGPFRPEAAPGQQGLAVPAGAGASAVGGGVTFDFVFNTVTYTVQVYAPDANGQYGFAITQGTTTIASLIYKDTNDWKIAVGLPRSFEVDPNLTINTLTMDIQHGTVTPLS